MLSKFKLLIVCIILVFALSSCDLLYSGKDIVYLFEKQMYDFENGRWSNQYYNGVLSPYGTTFFDWDGVTSVDYEDGYLFITRDIGDDLIVETRNLERNTKKEYNLTDSTFIKGVGYGDTGAILFHANILDETWVFYDNKRFGPAFGDIVDIDAHKGTLFMTIMTGNGRRIFTDVGPIDESYGSTFEIHEIKGELGYIAGKDDIGNVVVYDGKEFGSEYSEIIDLFDADKHLIYLAKKESGELVYSRQRIVSIFGKKFFWFKKEIPVGVDYDKDATSYVSGANVYYLDCEESNLCDVYKNGEIINYLKGSVLNMEYSNGKVFYTLKKDGDTMVAHTNGYLISEYNRMTVIYVI